MKISTLGFYLLHPVKALRRALYKVYEIRHKDEPWLAKRAVEYCEGILTKEMHGLEWGSGRSTCWFAGRINHLVSVEYDQESSFSAAELGGPWGRSVVDSGAAS